MLSLYKLRLFYTRNLIFPAFLRGVYGKDSTVLGMKKNTREKKRLVLIRCEQPERLKKTELLFLAVLRAAGLSSSPCLYFRFLSNTYRTNYAHHLLVLDRVWTLACKLEWVKVCQGQKPLEKVCGLSCGFQSGLCNMCGRHFFREHA